MALVSRYLLGRVQLPVKNAGLSLATRASGGNVILTMPDSVLSLTIRNQIVPAVVAHCWLMTGLIRCIRCSTYQK